MMLPHHFLNPISIGAELIYSLIIIILCSLIFFKTKEMSNLTKHRGIQFFRYAFLFFGLAYTFRMVLYAILLNPSFHFIGMGRLIRSLIRMVTAYFSTMAIFSLVYSTIWKKINIKPFLIISNLISILIAVIAFIFKSQMQLSLIQLLLLIISIVIIHKKTTKTKILYYSIFLVWLLSLVALDWRRLVPLELKVLFQIFSIGIFAILYYKVTKWIK